MFACEPTARRVHAFGGRAMSPFRDETTFLEARPSLRRSGGGARPASPPDTIAYPALGISGPATPRRRRAGA